jgi:hypothetical protein
MEAMKPIPIHAFNPSPLTGEGNTTWLIPGHVPTLIDAGTGEPRHLDALERALDGARLAQVLVTHSHIDHASGAAAIAERMPHVRFLKMPWPEHDHQWRVRWESLTDGEAVPAGDTVVTAIRLITSASGSRTAGCCSAATWRGRARPWSFRRPTAATSPHTSRRSNAPSSWIRWRCCRLTAV